MSVLKERPVHFVCLPWHKKKSPKWKTQKRIHRKNATLLGTFVPRLNRQHTPHFTLEQLYPISTHSFNSLLNESGERQEWRKKHVDENKRNERMKEEDMLHWAYRKRRAECVCMCVSVVQ